MTHVRSPLTRRLPVLDAQPHRLTTWRGWTWHHLSCPCRTTHVHALPVVDVRGRGTTIPLALARAHAHRAARTPEA